MEKHHLEHLKSIVESAIGGRAMPTEWVYSTPLLGSIGELDSMALLAILTQIEEDFGVKVDDSEISAEIFESVGSLGAFVQAKLDA
jgi:acyl carrier protein